MEEKTPGAAGGETHSLRRSVFVSLAVACSAVAVILLVTLSLFYQASALDEAREMLSRECAAVATAVDDEGGTAGEVELLSSTDFGEERVTLVSPDGTVLYDSRVDAASLENHASRPEIADAYRTGEGESDRDSDTLGYVSLYHAKRLPSGNVVRLGLERSSVGRILSQDLVLMALVVACLVVVSWFVSSRALSPSAW